MLLHGNCCNKRILVGHRLLICIVTVCLAGVAQATVLSSSSLETCVRDVNTAAQDISCQKKLVLTLAVANGQALETETIDFDVTCVGR